jgi:site-specific recombinase XerD
LVSKFIDSRREGLSQHTFSFYKTYLSLSRSIVGLSTSSQQINELIKSRNCSGGGKHAYCRVLRVFYNWLFSSKSGYKLNPQDNSILSIDPPKVERKILPSLTPEQLDFLIEQAGNVRDKVIISLFADSGLRLSELTGINVANVDWENRLVKVWCKGNKEGLAPFGEKTELLLKNWLSQYETNDRLWDLNKWGIVEMLQQMRIKIGLPCNPHTFRRTFASILVKKGVDSLHIMRLGRWGSIQMVERYTRSVRFEDSLKLYSAIVDWDF